MSALAHAAPAGAAQAEAEHGRARAAPGAERLSVRVAAFFALGALASLEYATLLTRIPTGRILGVAAIASAGGALIAASAARRLPYGLSTPLRVLLLLAMLALSLLLIGVPAHDLRPGGWGRLERGVAHGVEALEAWLWPYRGADRWARLSVLMVIPAALTTSASVLFWPAARSWGRSVAALAVLLALYITGLANATGPASGFQGAALLLLIVAWLWAPTLAPANVGRAGLWLVACSAGALALAPALSSSRPWIDYRHWDPTPAALASSFQWDELYGPLPWSRSSQTVFTVSARRRPTLRVTSLDRFDGLRFLRSTQPPGQRRFDVGRPKRRAWYTRATFSVDALRSGLLVSAGGAPLAVRWLSRGGPALQAEADGTTLLSSVPAAGSAYQLVAYEPRPSAAEMRAAPRVFPLEYLPYVHFELPGPSASAFKRPDLAAEARARYTPFAHRVESSPYGPMFALARGLAAGARSNFEAVERIEHYLSSNYTYDENVPQARYPLEAFLFQQRRGYCQQFSGAMTLMLRMLGIPARVGVGFKPEVFDPGTGTWRVRALDAHAWVEVFFPGIGWVSFDPTPPRPANANASASSLLPKGSLLGSGHDGAGSPARVARSRIPRAAAAGGPGAVALAALALAGLAGAWLLLTCLAARRRLRRGLRGDCAGAIEELRFALARLRYPATRATTLHQLESQLADARARDAARYLASLRELRFGAARSEPPERRGRAALRRALAARSGRLGRVRALLALPPGGSRAAAGAHGARIRDRLSWLPPRVRGNPVGLRD